MVELNHFGLLLLHQGYCLLNFVNQKVVIIRVITEVKMIVVKVVVVKKAILGVEHFAPINLGYLVVYLR